ncbi:MAG TPA: ABC transporter permease [Burkholderiales bacterium]|nr:ABC transporter permease [Burkholderiales bacterium]
MSNRIATIGRYAVLEALRTRLPGLTALSIAVVLGASFFVREITITDSVRFQTAFYAATARFAMFFLAALHVISSISRDFHEKGLDMALALDLPRSHYVLGKLCGFLAIAVALAIAATLPLFALTGWEATAIWGLSLALELTIVVALSLFCVITFTSIMPAASFVLAFYLLARALTAMRLISAHPVAGSEAPSHKVMSWVIEGLALVVPALDRWTRTEWLVDGTGSWPMLASLAGYTAMFGVVVVAAAIFDMQRRNF